MADKNRYLDPNLLSNYTWDQLVAASQNGELEKAGYGDIKYNAKTGKFDTPSWFNDHAVTLNKNASGGITPYAEEASHGWISDHKKELWTAAALAAGGYGLATLGGGAAAGTAAGAGSGLGATSIAALTPEAVFAGGLGASGSAIAGIAPELIAAAGGPLGIAGGAAGLLGSAAPALSAAPAVSGGSSSALSGSNMLKYGQAAAGLLGGVLGGQGTPGTTSTAQNKIDPRMDKYIYGDTGILERAKQMYDANPNGMNAQMTQGLNNSWNAISDPSVKQGYSQMQNTGMGLMNAPIAGNPFTNGMNGKAQINAPSLSGLLPSSPDQGPFSLMALGKNLVPYSGATVPKFTGV